VFSKNRDSPRKFDPASSSSGRIFGDRFNFLNYPFLQTNLWSRNAVTDNCRGGPPWPPVFRDMRVSKKRAATEGRPYSCFQQSVFQSAFPFWDRSNPFQDLRVPIWKLKSPLIGSRKLLLGSANSCLNFCRVPLGFQKSHKANRQSRHRISQYRDR